MTEDDRQGLLDVFTLYDAIMDACEHDEYAAQDALTALTLVIKDLALNHHSPQNAREKTVTALDRAFALEETSLPSVAVH